MSSHFTLFMAGKTDTGLKRDHNEDFIAWDAERGLALLADGMGGHKAGDVASRMSVEHIEKSLRAALTESLPATGEGGVSPLAGLLDQAIDEANSSVFAAGEENAAQKGMGTTLVALMLHADRVLVAHVGDSRLYRLHGRELSAVTRDHSLVRQMMEEGIMTEEEAHDSPFTHVITQAVGVREAVDAEIQEFEAQAGDVYLLCSDGLSDLVSEAEIADTLLAAQGNWERAAQRLVDLANQHGGRDNISVVIVGIGPPRGQ